MNRRQFLRRLGIAAGATLGTTPLRELAFVSAAAPLHVVIVGAGLAGLCAALELERRGHTCTILEAETKHVGGRARTLRFGDGLYGEAGAMRVPKNHALTRHYVAEMGLTLRPFVQSNPDAFVFARERRERMRDVVKLGAAYGLAPGELGKSPDDLWGATVGRDLENLTKEERDDLLSIEPATDAIRVLDGLSLGHVLDNAGLSAEAIEYLAVAAGIETLLDSAATEHFREEHLGVWTQGFDEIVGGTDRLPAKMAAALRRPLRMGCEVIRLEQDPLRRKAAAIYREGPRERRVEGDFLLCTLPFPVLSRVEADFSGGKRRAIRELAYDSSTKILAVTSRRFWEQDNRIYGGGTFTDLPTGTTWYPSDNASARDPKVSAAPATFLASYSWGQTARRWGSMSHTARSQRVTPPRARASSARGARHRAPDRELELGHPSLEWRRLRMVHAGPAHRAPPSRRRTRRTDLLRRRTRLADAHLDAGRARIGVGRRAPDAGGEHGLTLRALV